MMVNAVVCSILFKENLFEGEAVFICDNESLIGSMTRILSNDWVQLKRNCSEYDLLATIRDLLLPFKTNVRMEWVRGHQDKKVCPTTLPLKAQINVTVDSLATQAHPALRFPINPIFPSGVTDLRIRGESVTRYQRRAILNATHWSELLENIKKKNSWTKGEESRVCWDALASAMATFSHGRRSTAVQFCNAILPVNRVMARRDIEVEVNICPVCEDVEETQQHFLNCPEQTPWREEALQNCRSYLTTSGTAPDLRDLLLHILFDLPPPHCPQSLNQCLEDLQSVTSDACWRGKFPTSVGETQEAYARSQGRDQDGVIWLSGLIQTCINQVLSLWKKRNLGRHGETKQEQQEIIRDRTIKRFTVLSIKIAALEREEDKTHFTLSLQTALATPTSTLQALVNWGWNLWKCMFKHQALRKRTAVTGNLVGTVDRPPLNRTLTIYHPLSTKPPTPFLVMLWCSQMRRSLRVDSNLHSL